MRDEVLDALVAEYGAMEPGVPVPDLIGYANRIGLDFHGYASMARIQFALLDHYEALLREEAEREATDRACACRCASREEVTPTVA